MQIDSKISKNSEIDKKKPKLSDFEKHILDYIVCKCENHCVLIGSEVFDKHISDINNPIIGIISKEINDYFLNTQNDEIRGIIENIDYYMNKIIINVDGYDFHFYLVGK